MMQPSSSSMLVNKKKSKKKKKKESDSLTRTGIHYVTWSRADRHPVCISCSCTVLAVYTVHMVNANDHIQSHPLLIPLGYRIGFDISFN